MLNIKVITNAPRSEIVGESGGFLKIKLNAVREKGKANEELIKVLSEEYNVPKSNITIKRGKNSRKKQVALTK
ncbi:DUF167 domain-containing protein [Patescibacteria group bacterium]|nr:DUF167 domain-containing protein [Patescibacteria group bacterium]MBU1673775.1 DUF167 domain-containing protein [Patescibacteria group bacterium]MBU1964115.1 DUF167 domain-containing protein [Patescibacteria group bacterium]